MECTLDALFPSPGAGLDSHEQPQVAEDAVRVSCPRFCLETDHPRCPLSLCSSGFPWIFV